MLLLLCSAAALTFILMSMSWNYFAHRHDLISTLFLLPQICAEFLVSLVSR
jgi:hypothetical protein